MVKNGSRGNIIPGEETEAVTEIRCTDCKAAYPLTGLPFRCTECGGIYDFDGPPLFSPERIEDGLPGYWRHRHSFSLFEGAPLVSLGEGNTPLLWEKFEGHEVALKLESLQPTGSYKDRGSAVLVSQLLGRGVREAVEDSSGNAGASFAAYAAQAGLTCRVYVPEAASGPKRVQIEQYGAKLMRIPGPRSEAARAVLVEADAGVAYASHAYLPFGLPGIATIAYEIWEQLGRQAPGSLVAPVGHGGLLLGIVRGFSALESARLIGRKPFYLGVQAAACDPVVRAFQHGLEAMTVAGEEATVAEGVRVRMPVRARALIQEIKADQGAFCAVPETEILPAFHALARRGYYVEPTSALVWAVLSTWIAKLPKPVVVVLTGLGLKYMPST